MHISSQNLLLQAQLAVSLTSTIFLAMEVTLGTNVQTIRLQSDSSPAATLANAGSSHVFDTTVLMFLSHLFKASFRSKIRFVLGISHE